MNVDNPVKLKSLTKDHSDQKATLCTNHHRAHDQEIEVNYFLKQLSDIYYLLTNWDKRNFLVFKADCLVSSLMWMGPTFATWRRGHK